MYITHHQGVIDRRTVDSLWSLHEASMAEWPLGPAGEVTGRAEFVEMLADDCNRVWVLHDGSRPVASCVVATQAAQSQHLSRGYFEDHHPDQVRRNAVQMIAWLDIHPDADTLLAVKHLVESVTELAEAEGAVLVFDTHEVYDDAGAPTSASPVSLLADSMRSTQDVDVQRFYVVDFAEPDAAAIAGRYADDFAEPVLRRVV
jgi:hypothetical protein